MALSVLPRPLLRDVGRHLLRPENWHFARRQGIRFQILRHVRVERTLAVHAVLHVAREPLHIVHELAGVIDRDNRDAAAGDEATILQDILSYVASIRLLQATLPCWRSRSLDHVTFQRGPHVSALNETIPLFVLRTPTIDNCM